MLGFSATGSTPLGSAPVSTVTVSPPVVSVPDAPSITSITAGNGQVVVAFAPPANDGGSPITSYSVLLSNGQNASVTSSPATISSPNGTAVTATARAVNSQGPSAASAPSASVTPSAPVVSVPGKPIITEISASDGMVKVWFLPPVSDGGSPIISYQLALSDGTVVPATASPATAPVANGVTVVAVMKAINENGIGPASDQSASVTPQATTGEITPMNFTPSVSRSIRILPGRVVYEVGSFWTVSGTTGPVGTKDPNATIDISFDWTAWLADIGNVPLDEVFFILGGGLESEGAIKTPVGGTVFVSGGALNTDCTITCRITTDTVPVRIEDRTATLRIRDQ